MITHLENIDEKIILSEYDFLSPHILADPCCTIKVVMVLI